MKTSVKAGLLAAMFAAASPAYAAVNLVTNGDFSSPNTAGGYTISSSVPGWTGAMGVVEVGNSAIYGLSCANAGCQNAEVLTNGSPDSLSQTVNGLTVGRTYDVSWLYGGRVGNDATMDTSFGGALLATNSDNLGSWKSNSYTIIATSTSENLIFSATALSGCASCGAEVTNVSVSAVPEASTWAMMLLGFAGLGFAGYRARQKAATPA